MALGSNFLVLATGARKPSMPHCGNFKLQSRLHNAIIVNPAIEPASLDTEYMIADPCIIRDQMGQPIKREQQQAK
jgi:hypothetical protein